MASRAMFEGPNSARAEKLIGQIRDVNLSGRPADRTGPEPDCLYFE